MFLVLLIAAYVVTTFLLSALVVRLSPRSRISRDLRLRLWLLLLLPVLVLLDLPRIATGRLQRLANGGSHVMRALFTRLSGHRPYLRYGYPYSRPPRNRAPRDPAD